MATQIAVPDLGVEQAEVIELLVPAGATVKKDQPIALLESDKASLELPATEDGVLVSWSVKVGSVVKAGDALLMFEIAGAVTPAVVAAPVAVSASVAQPSVAAVVAPAPAVASVAPRAELVPDLGVEQAEIIELLVPAGATIKKDQPIALLESDKASLELPATQDGVLVSWSVKVGQMVKAGDALLTLQPGSAGAVVPQNLVASAPVVSGDKAPAGKCHAGPAVRRLARELGADLTLVTGSGPRGRILKDDLHAWVKQRLTQPVVSAPAGGSMAGLFGDLPPEPDYTKWGAVELKPRSRIQRKSAENLVRSALIVPQVTQFDLADITDLEAFRLSLRDSFKKDGLSLTMTVLVAKAVAYLLREMPMFNSSLARDGENLVVKDYVNLGIAVDTANGLLVPVLHNADRMSLSEMARKLGELSERARTGKLPPAEMQGATFTISSLGGVGGTAFTPLVNWPEVGILGLSRASQQPVWDGQGFMPRLMLPLSLSYDHRVIDGAAAARFTTRLAVLLADIRRLMV